MRYLYGWFSHSAIFFLLFILVEYNNTSAIPSFARQTNLSCNTCHTIFPELNAFGRLFKLNGYTLVASETVQAMSDSETVALRITKIPPISAMMIASYTYKSKEQPSTQNSNFSLPQQFSLFYGGAITPKIGSFIQVTYSDQDGAIGLDNSEIRFADQTEFANESFTYGVTLNNNPSMQDLWNSTPSWRFPFTSSSVSPSPMASTLIEGGLAQSVAGLGVYSLWNNLIYTEISLYRSAQQGAQNPPDSSSTSVLKSVAPYWRLALQKQWDTFYLELGTYGLSANLYPIGVSGLTDQYTDVGFDLNIEKVIDNNMFTVHGSLIHESRTSNADFTAGNTTNLSGTLDSFRLVGNYYLHSQIGFSLGYFSITGDGDALLYAPESVNGSINGIPNSNGLIFEFDYLPWYNTKLAVQYLAYTKFNGSSDNYDGQGRAASDNNNLYLSCWVAF
ncbi:MAG: hypothetical protein NTX65_01935 [Ignavibacteriales bacterium]|nr:hypothetical protein [Ignavibacteriales bacterium]